MTIFCNLEVFAIDRVAKAVAYSSNINFKEALFYLGIDGIGQRGLGADY